MHGMVPDSQQLKGSARLCRGSTLLSLKDTSCLPSKGLLMYSDCLCLLFFMEKVCGLVGKSLLLTRWKLE